MTRWGPAQLLLTLLLCVLGWAVIAAACLCVGSTTHSFHWPTTNLLNYRLEIVLRASLIGGSLAAAGVIYQAVLRNPLADPYLLGVSSGASLAAYVWQFAGFAAVAAALGQQLFAFIGAIASIAIVFTLSVRRGRLEPVTLLLMGVIVSSINGSIFLLLNTLYRDPTGGSGGPLTFLIGSISTNPTTWQVRSAAIVSAAGFATLLALAGQFNVAGLAETEATALGINVNRLRWIGLGVASLMTAAVVAISGPIGFVGLVCPHVGRGIVGNDQRKLLPVATAIGAALLAVADAVSRRLSATDSVQTILPVGVLTGLLGGPFFLLLLWQQRRRSQANLL